MKDLFCKRISYHLTAPVGKVYLFPYKASHTQLLAMTGKTCTCNILVFFNKTVEREMQNANHKFINVNCPIALTGKLASSDARILPPDIPRGRVLTPL